MQVAWDNPDISTMPGHWLLARLGKRVLRPGGLELTAELLERLGIGEADSVVEFAPGLGVTTRLALERRPRRYVAVERDERAAEAVRPILSGPGRECRVGAAERTGLPDGSASVVFGEAMLSMQSAGAKEAVVREAARLLAPGGRYGVHELALVPDEVDEGIAREIRGALARSIRVGVAPLTVAGWRALLESGGFTEVQVACAPMRLLEPARLVRDEGLPGALRFARNLIADPESRSRVLAMRRAFRKHAAHLAAVAVVARKGAAALS